MSPDEMYQRSRARVRYRPAWWLRRRDRQIVAVRPRPSNGQLAELGAIRQELQARRQRRAPAQWRAVR